MISKAELIKLQALLELTQKYNISTFTYTNENGCSFSVNGIKEAQLEPVKEKPLSDTEKEERFFDDLYAAVPGYTRFKEG